MDLENVKTIGVVGAGTMGSGIAQVCAEAGFTVYLFDETLEKAMEGKTKIEQRFEKIVEKKRGNREYVDKTTINGMNNILANIIPLILKGLESVKKMPQLFIEAVFEDLNVKQAIFRELDRLCGPETILATNTSSIPIHKIAEAVSDERKKKIIGMHFMNPPYILKLLEIVKSEYTSDETYQFIQTFAKKLERDPILTSKDAQGFIVNAVLMPSLRQALICLEHGIGNAIDINQSIKIGVGGAMGPLDLGDLIGWDIVLNILDELYEYYGEYKPPQILHHLVQEGFLGRKTGKGIFDFYNFRKEQK